MYQIFLHYYTFPVVHSSWKHQSKYIKENQNLSRENILLVLRFLNIKDLH